MRKGRKAGFSRLYFDFFWGCPDCRRALSIAEVIERHCEACGGQVEPAQMHGTAAGEGEHSGEKAA
ncbi:MAG: hypothetical protein QM636_23155 [Rhizobium sp.]